MAIIGQTGELVPADKRLYALRDVTATVDIIPLIASSIMSKKIAGGADAIVLDVKVGDGAFMKDLDSARELAEAMRELGVRAGREVVCELTDMDQPLGQAVGNALEIREAVDCPPGRGARRISSELVLGAAEHLLVLSDLGVDARRRAARAGRPRSPAEAALEVYERWIRAQGGDPSLDALPQAPVVNRSRARVGRRICPAHRDDRDRARQPSASAPAGSARRTTSTTPWESSVSRSAGSEIAAGDVIAEVHARTEESAEAGAAEVAAAYHIGPEPPQDVPIVLDVIA